jgi:hypothetical protein
MYIGASTNAKGATHMTNEVNGRKLRTDLTAEQLAKLQEFGAIDFKSAGAVRKSK